MSDRKRAAETYFPSLAQKLGAPVKRTKTEQKRLEDEEKEKRQKEESASYLREFELEMQSSNASSIQTTQTTQPQNRSLLPPGLPGNRETPNVISAMAKTGPGSLDAPASSSMHALQPRTAQPSHTRFPASVLKSKKKPTLLFHSSDEDSDHPDDESTADTAYQAEVARLKFEKAQSVPKLTILVENLVAGTSQDQVELMFPSDMKVDAVKILPSRRANPNSPLARLRKSLSVIVIFVSGTSQERVKETVAFLNKTYVGFGHHLVVSEFVSHIALDTALAQRERTPVNPSTAMALPFGAVEVSSAALRHRLTPEVRNPHRGGIAPPPEGLSSAASVAYSQGRTPASSYAGDTLLVDVIPPDNVFLVQLIHATVAAIAQAAGEARELEATLMSMEVVQMDEDWEWLFNARSQAGKYYRWLLWSTIIGAQWKMRYKEVPSMSDLEQIFDLPVLEWLPSKAILPFEYISSHDALTEHPDWEGFSDDDDDDDDDASGYDSEDDRTHSSRLIPTNEKYNISTIPTKERARFTLLLSNLPASHAHLQNFMLALPSDKAIKYNEQGLVEFANMMVANILEPYSLRCQSECFTIQQNAAETPAPTEEDRSGAAMVGLLLLSQVLFCATEVVSHKAYRYRPQFEMLLRKHDVFAKLGRLHEDHNLGWGKMRIDKWRKGVNYVLEHWAMQNAFTKEAQQSFVNDFNQYARAEEAIRIARYEEVEAARVARHEEAKQAEVRAKSDDPCPSPNANVDTVVNSEQMEYLGSAWSHIAHDYGRSLDGIEWDAGNDGEALTNDESAAVDRALNWHAYLIGGSKYYPGVYYPRQKGGSPSPTIAGGVYEGFEEDEMDVDTNNTGVLAANHGVNNESAETGRADVNMEPLLSEPKQKLKFNFSKSKPS